MGQGAQTALAMMAAEEMDADWNLVRVKEAPALDAYANAYIVRAFTGDRSRARSSARFDYGTYRLARWYGLQATGGSMSVRGTGVYGMRVAGAAAREMLIAAAAGRFGVGAAECTAVNSRVVHEASGKSATFGELATGGREAAGAVQAGAEGSGNLHDPPHGAPALRHPLQGRRQRHLRHRLQHAGHAVRRRRDRAGLRRQARVRRQRPPPKRCPA